MVKINFEFRDKLEAMIEGSQHNFCYQCGACVPDCPAAQYSEEFNPRIIMQRTLLGLEDTLLGPDSVIWQCTNCYSCYERCPQDVRPIEIIIALKNLTCRERQGPNLVNEIAGRMLETGWTVRMSDTISRRRKELNLPELKDVREALSAGKMSPLEEVAKILED